MNSGFGLMFVLRDNQNMIARLCKGKTSLERFSTNAG